MKHLKVLTILGTRPEIIRLSATIKLLEKYTNHILVHTGQNYDYALNEIFFEDLDLSKPDYYLNVSTETLGTVLGETLIKSEEVLKKENPDAVLILGDTNSSIAGIMAKRLKIPVFHMEAGNRSFDANVPEELNRKIIDHIADFNLVYTEHARRHLLSEGLPHRRIYLTGSPMFEVLNNYKEKIEKSNILKDLNLKEKEYFLVSVHREENVDNKNNLEKILNVLDDLANQYKIPIIISTHPRTKKMIEKLDRVPSNHNRATSNEQPGPSNELLRFLKPFSFTDYVHLQMNALCTLSDSGTISEESAILSFPAISIRQSMERPEAQDAGTIILSGFDSEIILNSIDIVINEHERGKYKQIPPDYTIENTSCRVLKLIIGNAGLSNKWHGIEN